MCGVAPVRMIAERHFSLIVDIAGSGAPLGDIVSVQRIQHKKLWKKYVFYRQEMIESLKR